MGRMTTTVDGVSAGVGAMDLVTLLLRVQVPALPSTHRHPEPLLSLLPPEERDLRSAVSLLVLPSYSLSPVLLADPEGQCAFMAPPSCYQAKSAPALLEQASLCTRAVLPTLKGQHTGEPWR